MRVGLLYQNINRCSGREVVAISMIRCLKRLGFRIVLLCGKRVDEASVLNHFGMDLQVDKELVFPIWTRNIQAYFQFMLPSILKPLCDIIVNPYTNDLSPGVDVTYINGLRILLLRQKARNHKLWNYYYKPYQVVERALGFRASHELVIANSFFTADALRKQIGINPIVIYPPVFLKKPVYPVSNVIKENSVLTIASFSQRKKLEQVPLVAQRIDADFVILGSMNDGASYRRVRRLTKEYGVGDKVTMFVDAPNDLKMELLRKAKVYFHTMPFEPFGISIVEGMGAGCIPVVHDSGGPREFVPRRWRYRDAGEAVQKIKEALRSWNPSVAEDMRNIAYRFREERFQNEFSTTLKSYLMEREQ